MEIIVADQSGLCYGVKRALRLAHQIKRRRKGPVFTFGELIHNPTAIADLKESGIHPVNDVASIRKGTVIIRSHGVAPSVYSALKKKRVDIVDATCPIVKGIQGLVAKLANKGEEIVIVGNPEHPEVQGLVGHSRGRARIIEDEAQARRLPLRKKRSVLAQSTEDPFLFGQVVAALLERTKELGVYNTICNSTQIRQKSTCALASRVDILFIIGGKKSSNTQRLFEISKRVQPNTHFVETADEIRPRLLRGVKRIGISGGASTPPEAIQEVVSKIRSGFAHSSHRETLSQWQS